jgi:hypothetical protein
VEKPEKAILNRKREGNLTYLINIKRKLFNISPSGMRREFNCHHETQHLREQNEMQREKRNQEQNENRNEK